MPTLQDANVCRVSFRADVDADGVRDSEGGNEVEWEQRPAAIPPPKTVRTGPVPRLTIIEQSWILRRQYVEASTTLLCSLMIQPQPQAHFQGFIYIL